MVSFEMADALVETVMSAYPAKGASKLQHYEKAAEIYGQVMPHESVESQMHDMGVLVAALLWKLAEARGKVPVDAQ